jgi:hypothetical protein
MTCTVSWGLSAAAVLPGTDTIRVDIAELVAEPIRVLDERSA